MEFEKYQHIERLGNVEVEGILDGKVYIFPKLDGTNASIWADSDGNLCAGSRRRRLYGPGNEDNQGFWQHVMDNKELYFPFFQAYPGLRLYGEWLVPHTFKGYRDDAWNKFYVFDVTDKEGAYCSYEHYRDALREYNINYIPAMCTTENPTGPLVEEYLHNTFLCKEGQVGEGIVLKNYDFVNRFGRITWAKVVRNEFKDSHGRNNPTPVREGKKVVEADLVKKCLHADIIDKVHARLVAENNGWTSKLTGRLLEQVFHDFVTEEIWNMLRAKKHAVIDFGNLRRFTNIAIKDHLKL